MGGDGLSRPAGRKGLRPAGPDPHGPRRAEDADRGRKRDAANREGASARPDARGALGGSAARRSELRLRLPEIQEELLWLCEAAHVPVIWATQVLEGFVKNGIPTRAEMTDAAMGNRAECVMLNKGPYLADAVNVLGRVLSRMQDHQYKKTPQLRALRSWR